MTRRLAVVTATVVMVTTPVVHKNRRSGGIRRQSQEFKPRPHIHIVMISFVANRSRCRLTTSLRNQSSPSASSHLTVRLEAVGRQAARLSPNWMRLYFNSLLSTTNIQGLLRPDEYIHGDRFYQRVHRMACMTRRGACCTTGNAGSIHEQYACTKAAVN